MVTALFDEIAADCGDAPRLAALARECAAIARWMAADAGLDDRLAGSVAFCTMGGVAVAGWQLLRQARSLAGETGPLARAKPVTARFLAEQLADEAMGLATTARAGSALLYALSAEDLCA